MTEVYTALAMNAAAAQSPRRDWQRVKEELDAAATSKNASYCWLAAYLMAYGGPACGLTETEFQAIKTKLDGLSERLAAEASNDFYARMTRGARTA